MARNAHAAGLILGGLSLEDAESGAAETLASYAAAGIRAYILPGALLRREALLAGTVELARRLCAEAGLGRALVALGGWREPGFGLPPLLDGPNPLALAALGSPPAARRAGRLLGWTLSRAGIDLAMGPRLDLATDPKDGAGAIDGFGQDAAAASALGAAFIAGLAASGVQSCAGRFPGLGSICADCYDGLPFISLPAARLESCEMLPFARASRSGVAAILIGRVLVPAMEPERIPASRSARLIEGRLREELRFRGLAIGDRLDQEADPGKTALLSVLAGCDLCLAARPETALTAAAALDRAAAAGELPALRAEVAHRRIQAFLDKAARREPRTEAVKAAKGLRAVDLRRADRDREGALTVLRGSLVLERREGDFRGALVLVFLPPGDSPDAAESESALPALREALPGATIVAFGADPLPGDAEELSSLLAGSAFAEAVVLTFDAHFRPAQEGLAHLVEESLPRVLVITLRDPYDAAFFPRAAGLGAAYGFSGGSFRAIGRLLRGEARPRGSCPVPVIGLEV